MKISINNLITIGWREDAQELHSSEYAGVAAFIAGRVTDLAMKQFEDDPKGAWFSGMLCSVAQSLHTGGPLPSEKVLLDMMRDANRHQGVVVWPTGRGTLLEADLLTRGITEHDALAWCFTRQPELMERDYSRPKKRYNWHHVATYGRKH
ncbi:hypothetical protein SJR98_07450 [Aeromonas hydrophila]|uniref:hypothetical protein n=1 Tax=Aeromonas hydrophila TaxID=644 RepID=UPI0029DACE2E|nr:hypothetical protein [Aeromonas hydrophila]MDX7777913.1 hypothetical protein [Aeromonas hydrophila]